MPYRRAFAAFGTFCAAAIALAGCSSGGAGSQPGASTSATANGGAASPVVTEMPTSTSGATATGNSGLTVTVTGLPAKPVLTPGGPALQFTVDIKNGTHRTFREVTPVVAMEHCTCINTAAQPAPKGVLQEYALATGKWQTVSYDTMGIGLDYLNVVEQPPLTLNPGATLSFTFRVRLRTAAHQPITVHAGETGLLVTVVRHSAGSSATTSSILAYTQIKVPVTAG